METLQDMLSGFERLESPVARRLLRRMALGAASGRLSEDDLEVVASLAEHMAAQNAQGVEIDSASITAGEMALVQSFRRLTPRQQEGAKMMLDVFKPADGLVQIEAVREPLSS
ncbi:TPA: hypothetical protein L6A07_24940 [Pseudomonas aeruginosa]|nr:hypothetical protein [Pseudomonas aeruginosa]HBP6378436.1 hypothetical protein [Pseudomonas aeruginosa]